MSTMADNVAILWVVGDKTEGVTETSNGDRGEGDNMVRVSMVEVTRTIGWVRESNQGDSKLVDIK